MQAIQEIVAALAGATERELARTALAQALEQSASDEITRERLKQLLDASDHWAMDRVSRPLVDAVFCLSAPAAPHTLDEAIRHIARAVFDHRAKADAGATAAQLADKFWLDEVYPHPAFSIDKWRHAVYHFDTRLGYWDWVADKLNSRAVGAAA